ncbi:MAG: glycosyltransferase, partial [Gemmatimonadetes bacterium]|nr:glycosyltransferase [Gemmatimonadota bacterium]
MPLKSDGLPEPSHDFLDDAPNAASGGLLVASWFLLDRVRPLLPWLGSEVGLWASRLAAVVRSDARLKGLMASQRYRPRASTVSTLRSVLEKRGTPGAEWMPDDIRQSLAAHRTIVLRPPVEGPAGPIPGVLLVKFTETLRFYAHHIDFGRLQRYFRVVLEPSWAGYALPELLALHGARDPILVQAAEKTDRELLRQLDGALKPVPLGSGEWVDHRVFRPLGLERDYGAVYVANYNSVKRVPAFLRVVARIVSQGVPFKAALVCSRWGRGRRVVQAFVRWYGLAEHVDVYESIEHDGVNVVLNRARCGVLMSRKEGSNRSLFEGMHADTPGVLLDENVGVNQERLTAQSGVVAPEGEFAGLLTEISSGARTFSARRWALETIAPEVSARTVERE